MRDNSCYHPFHGLDIDNNGTLRPCCKFKQQLYPGWKDYNVRNGINNYLNSDQIKRLQQDFAQGNRPAACVRCWKDEEAGFPSKRQMDAERWSEEINGEGVRFLGLPIGNFCNIKCRVCGPHASTTWIKEYQDLFGKKMSRQDWHTDPAIWNELISLSEDCLEIHIHGGEPFLHTNIEHQQLITNLVQSGKASRIRLHYSTNGTVFPNDQFYRDWDHFKSVDIQISIDDIKHRFEYNRHPSKWDLVQRHLEQYLERAAAHPNQQLSISTVVSAFTIYYLDELFDHLLAMGLPKPWLGRLHTPDHYRASIFGPNAKQEIRQKLLASPHEDVRNAAAWLDDDDSAQWDRFIQITQQHDQYRREDFASTFPELVEIISLDRTKNSG